MFDELDICLFGNHWIIEKSSYICNHDEKSEENSRSVCHADGRYPDVAFGGDSASSP